MADGTNSFDASSLECHAIEALKASAPGRQSAQPTPSPRFGGELEKTMKNPFCLDFLTLKSKPPFKLTKSLKKWAEMSDLPRLKCATLSTVNVSDLDGAGVLQRCLDSDRAE